MALKRTRITLTIDVIRDAKLTEDEVLRDFKRKVIEVHGPTGASSDEAHWFAADINVSNSTPVPLDGTRFSPAELDEPTMLCEACGTPVHRVGPAGYMHNTAAAADTCRANGNTGPVEPTLATSA